MLLFEFSKSNGAPSGDVIEGEVEKDPETLVGGKKKKGKGKGKKKGKQSLEEKRRVSTIYVIFFISQPLLSC